MDLFGLESLQPVSTNSTGLQGAPSPAFGASPSLFPSQSTQSTTGIMQQRPGSTGLGFDAFQGLGASGKGSVGGAASVGVGGVGSSTTGVSAMRGPGTGLGAGPPGGFNAMGGGVAGPAYGQFPGRGMPAMQPPQNPQQRRQF